MERFIKFLVVGTIGFTVNTVGLLLGVRLGLKPSIAGPLGAEFAIIVNFTLNNFWTFSDKQVTLSTLPVKFIQFNILSFGSVLIQFVFLKVGEKIFGLEKFKEPFINSPFISKLPILPELIKQPLLGGIAKKFTAYFIFYMMGVGVGLVVNFFIYSQIIWK